MGSLEGPFFVWTHYREDFGLDGEFRIGLEERDVADVEFGQALPAIAGKRVGYVSFRGSADYGESENVGSLGVDLVGRRVDGFGRDA